MACKGLELGISSQIILDFFLISVEGTCQSIGLPKLCSSKVSFVFLGKEFAGV